MDEFFGAPTPKVLPHLGETHQQHCDCIGHAARRCADDDHDVTEIACAALVHGRTPLVAASIRTALV